MTVKRRLFWSNILMIAVPVISTALIGIVCIGLIWLSLIGGAGLGIKNQEDGIKEEADEALLPAAGLLNGPATITLNGRSLYVGTERVKGTDYVISLFGSYNGRQTYSELKVALTLSAIVILFAIFASILLTNRFLTKFVFQRIEGALDILAGGVHEIRDGNLEYRIAYDRKDEFLPVCEDFNEMAVRLKSSVDGMQRQELSRKELIAGISHDLRSPLTSIQAYVEGLLDGVARTPEAQKRYLETIKGKARDLAHIISQLFLFSKMDLGENTENLCILRLDETIAETVSALEEEYREQGLYIHMESEQVELCADPVYLHRIAGAVKRMGGTIQARPNEPEGLCICIDLGVNSDVKNIDHRGRLGDCGDRA